MFDLAAVQAAIEAAGCDAWLLYDFRASNVLARRILQLAPDRVHSRRWLYKIPARGEPQKLVHRIESGALDHLPGEKIVYLRWQEFESGVAALLAGCRRVAMEYAPRGSNPYVSRVDAGLVELVRAGGAEVVSSGDLVQQFEATWSDQQIAMHFEAARHTGSAFDEAFSAIARAVRTTGHTTESQIQRVILDHFCDHGLITSHAPIVAAGPHSGDPHYETTAESDVPIRRGDFVLVDLWAKLDKPGSVYSDLTRLGFVGDDVPQKYESIFQMVAAARDAAINLVHDALAAGRALCGWEVDQAAREVIDRAGYGEKFCHRTGHSIGQETHGNGANMDNLETHELRQVLARTCFSIEPGIYLDEFGVRSEVNILVDAARKVHVTGPEPQRSILPILSLE